MSCLTSALACGSAIIECDGRALPLIFRDVPTADAFLSACERTGVNIWPGIAYDELLTLFRLWDDSNQRAATEALILGSIRDSNT